jgi:hypothetical protein
MSDNSKPLPPKAAQAPAPATATPKVEPAAKSAPKELSKADADKLRETRIAASRGGQVVLDPEGDAAIAARGGMGGSIEENSAVRDADLIDHGLDPAAPSGHLTDLTPEQIEARKSDPNASPKSAA